MKIWHLEAMKLLSSHWQAISNQKEFQQLVLKNKLTKKTISHHVQGKIQARQLKRQKNETYWDPLFQRKIYSLEVLPDHENLAEKNAMIVKTQSGSSAKIFLVSIQTHKKLNPLTGVKSLKSKKESRVTLQEVFLRLKTYSSQIQIS